MENFSKISHKKLSPNITLVYCSSGNRTEASTS
jgi:hypothetical protein